MSHSTPDYTRFDDYLSKIESMERAKRRRRVMMLIPVVAVLGGALWIYGIGKSKPLVPTETVAVSNEQFQHALAAKGRLSGQQVIGHRSQ